MNQLFISAAYARQVTDNITIGIAPIFAVQMFEAQGLAAFAFDPMANPLTVNPAKLSDNETDWSTGFGVRLGVEATLGENFRFGAAYQPKIDMSTFDEYAGLFEGGGDFDIPQNYTIGIAFDATTQTSYAT